MHVLQLGPYPPPEGGINRNMLAIREELLKNGYRCSIIATSRSSTIGEEPDVHHPRTAFELLTLLFKIDYDILHLHVGGNISTRVLELIFICSLFKRGKNILSFHSGGYPLSPEGMAAKKKSVRGFIFRRFHRIIAVNPLIAEVFERYGVEKEKVRVIYPFVHKSPDKDVQIPPELKDFATQHNPFLLSVCLLEGDYDLFMQIDAMEKVLLEFPGAGLMIVGSGSLEGKLRQAVGGKSYAEKILLAGDIEHTITLHLINQCDVLLRTTLFDGDAISVREALFLDTPVIATDNGIRPEGVHLIPIHDQDALIEQIRILASGEEQIKTAKADDKSNIIDVLKLYDEIFISTSR